MAVEQKTTPTGENVEAFLAAVPDETRREDAQALCELMSSVTGEAPHKAGKGCLYLERLADVDTDVLRDLIDRTIRVYRGVDTGTGG
jgi:hypothetical protein